MAQEALNAPFNDGHAGWIDPGSAGARFWAAEVRPDGKAVALEFSSPATGFGVVLAAADGTLGGATELECFLPAAGEATDVSWSPDGTMLTWADDQGVKVARAPDLSQPPAAEDKCVMGSAPKVLSATGEDPNFGGADVAAMIAARGGKTPPPGGETPDPVPGGSVAVKAPKKVKVKRGFKATVTAPGAGEVVAKLAKGRKVVGSGRATAAAAGPVKVKVKLRRGVRARSLRGKPSRCGSCGRAGVGTPRPLRRRCARARPGTADHRVIGARPSASRSARSVDQNASALQGRSAGS